MKVLFVVCALLLTACGPSAEEVIEKRKAGALAKLAVYSETVHKALASPVLTPPKLPVKLILAGDGQNAQLIHTEWVDGGHAESSVFFESNDFIDTRNWCNGSSPVSGQSGTTTTRYFDKFEAIQMFVALETLSYSAGYTNGTTYSPGSFHGRIHFIDVAKGSLGSVEIESGGSSDSLSAQAGHEAAEVKSDTWSHARDAVAKALEPYMAPGQKPF